MRPFKYVYLNLLLKLKENQIEMLNSDMKTEKKIREGKRREVGEYGNKYHQLLLSGGQNALYLKLSGTMLKCV